MKFLESIVDIFSNKKTHLTDQDTGYGLDEAIDRVIDGIDAKLRLVPGYRKKLQQDVANSLERISSLVDQIPGPMDVSRTTFVSDPEVRAYFATPDVLQNTFSCGSELTSFFDQLENSSTDECCALLCADKEEKQIMGTAIEGGMIRHDVMQTAINFHDYKILSPAISDNEVRRGIKQCVFDGLVTYALQHIACIKIERRDLRHQHRILHAQLRARQKQGNGLSALLAEAHFESDQSASCAVQFKEAEARLKDMIGDRDVFSFYLEEIRKIFAQSEDFIQLNEACFRLNDMGIKVDANDTQSANVVCFSELEIANVMKRVVAIVRYNRNDIDCRN